MTEGRRRDNWAMVSSVMCLLFNMNRDPKKSGPKDPEDFIPRALSDRRRSRGDVDGRVGVSALRDVFVNRQWPTGVLPP